jgi:hypothetical protein
VSQAFVLWCIAEPDPLGQATIVIFGQGETEGADYWRLVEHDDDQSWQEAADVRDYAASKAPNSQSRSAWEAVALVALGVTALYVFGPASILVGAP